MERDLKLDMEAKENLKGFNIGGEAGWYVTLLHFQTKIWILNDNFYIFPLFSDSIQLLPHKEKGSLLHRICKNSARVGSLSFSKNR